MKDDIFFDFELAIDPTGLVQPLEGKSGNGIISTVTAIYVLWIYRNEMTANQHANMWNMIYELVNAVKRCQIVDGFYRRHTTDFVNDQESVDDYIAIAALAAFPGSAYFEKLAIDVCRFGDRGFPMIINKKSHIIKWYFPNEAQFQSSFSWRAWLWRFQPMVCHMRQAAHQKTNFIQRLIWSFTVVLSGWLGGNPDDSWILSWLMINSSRSNLSLSQRIARKLYLLRLKVKGGIQVPLSRYYKGDHPIPKYAKDVV